MTADPYEIVGVRRDAHPDDVRRAYRRRARELHPDVNPDPDATTRFQELGEAFSILSDPARRAAFDAGGCAPPSATAADADPDEAAAPSTAAEPVRPWPGRAARRTAALAPIVVWARAGAAPVSRELRLPWPARPRLARDTWWWVVAGEHDAGRVRLVVDPGDVPGRSAQRVLLFDGVAGQVTVELRLVVLGGAAPHRRPAARHI